VCSSDLRKSYSERIEFFGDLLLPLREYPVNKVLAVYASNREQVKGNSEELIEPELYEVIPDCNTDYDFPFSISLSPALLRYRGLAAVKVVYRAGYVPGKVPADLASACLELAVWNMSRYKGRRVGMTGSVRGNGRDGEHFELAMPENVRVLLDPYRRKVI
jgi:hypothetical protein